MVSRVCFPDCEERAGEEGGNKSSEKERKKTDTRDQRRGWWGDE